MTPGCPFQGTTKEYYVCLVPKPEGVEGWDSRNVTDLNGDRVQGSGFFGSQPQADCCHSALPYPTQWPQTQSHVGPQLRGPFGKGDLRGNRAAYLCDPWVRCRKEEKRGRAETTIQE